MRIFGAKFLTILCALQLICTSSIKAVIDISSAQTILQKIEKKFDDLTVQDFDNVIEFYVVYAHQCYGNPTYGYLNENKLCTKITTIFNTTKTGKKLKDFIKRSIEKLSSTTLYYFVGYGFGALLMYSQTIKEAVLEKINIVPLQHIDYLLYSCQQSELLEFIKKAFSKPDTPIATLSRLLQQALSIGLILPAQYNEAALLKRAFLKDTPIPVLDALIKEYSARNTAIQAKYSIALIDKVKKFFKSPHPTITLTVLFMMAYHKNYLGTLPTNLPQLTQTQQHVIANHMTFLHSNTLTAYIDNQDYQNLVNNVMSKEQELAQLGYCTFVHGQKWKFRIIEEWYTKLWEIKNKQSAGDYLFIHCKKFSTDPKHLEQEKSLRTEIINNGRYNETIRRKLLFMNYSFFGNENNPGSCTAHYLLQNMNIRDISLSLENIFSIFGYEKIYQKHKQELDELEQEHDKLSTFGNLLVIGIPRTIVSECVYVARPGGYKHTIWIDGIGNTDNVVTIVDTLRNNPLAMSESNMLEFCLTLTDDLLTPQSGIKVYSYNCAAQAQFKEWQKKSNTLLNKIKKEIKN